MGLVLLSLQVSIKLKLTTQKRQDFQESFKKKKKVIETTASMTCHSKTINVQGLLRTCCYEGLLDSSVETDRQADRLRGKQAGRQRDRQRVTQTDRQTDRQRERDRRTDRERERQTDREKETDRQRKEER